MSKYQRLSIIFIGIYFGEPVLTQLVGRTSSLQYQLGMFILLLAACKIVSKRVFVAVTIIAALVLMWLIHVAADITLIKPLTEVVFALASAALVSAIIEAWESR